MLWKNWSLETWSYEDTDEEQRSRNRRPSTPIFNILLHHLQYNGMYMLCITSTRCFDREISIWLTEIVMKFLYIFYVKILFSSQLTGLKSHYIKTTNNLQSNGYKIKSNLTFKKQIFVKVYLEFNLDVIDSNTHNSLKHLNSSIT